MVNRAQIFYLTICAFGFGLAANLQTANLSTILQFSGFPSHIISYFWLIPPLTGLITQPVLGMLSDNIYTRLGRRKPFFLASTLLGVISLIFLPFTHDTLLLILLITFFDIGNNGNAQLARALVLDTTSKRNHTKAFSWITGLGGLGAVVAGLCPGFLVSILHCQDNSGFNMPDYINYTFFIGGVFYLITSMITLIKVKEEVKKAPRSNKNLLKKCLSLGQQMRVAIKNLPPAFWKLSSILFFAWVAIFAIWNYLTIHVAQTLFKMPIHVTDNMELASNYLAVANVWTSTCFGIVHISSTLFAFTIPILNRYIPIKQIFSLGLAIGALSVTTIAFCTSKLFMVILMIFYGISWAILTTCPYTIFSKMTPQNSRAYYMGILNISIVVPQIVAGLALGYIYKYLFHRHASLVILFAGIFLTISLTLSLKGYLKKKWIYILYNWKF